MDFWLFAISMTSAVCFALGLVLTTFGLRTLPPLVGVTFSVPSAFLLFLVLSPFTVDLSGFDWRALAIFAAAGAVYPAVVSLLNFVSNRAIGPNLTGGLGNLTPVFAIGLAVVILGEVPSVLQWLGVAAICAGLVMLALDRARRFPTGSLLILALPLAGAFFRGLVQPVIKIGLGFWPSAFAAALVAYGVSSLVVWAVRIGSRQRLPEGAGAGIAWFALLGVANGMALLLLYIALERGEVVEVAPLVATYPLITIALNRVIHGDRSMGSGGIVGSVLSVAGVIAVLLG